jgi:hypothetical protein
MGGGYAKIADPSLRDADGNLQYSQYSGDDPDPGSADGEGSRSGSSGGGGGGNDGADDHTPRTENEEIAKQAALAKSPHTSSGANGPPSTKRSKYASMKVKWADQTTGGPPLAEAYYSDKLHYSVLYS